MASEKEVTAIKDRVSFRLLDLPEVSGVGVEKDEAGGFVLAVHLNTDEAGIRKRVLDEVKGGPVRFVVSGPFEKQ
ncbi:MAG: hypothetical protein AABO41_12805 [Acidobacteriota bacterium]